MNSMPFKSLFLMLYLAGLMLSLVSCKKHTENKPEDHNDTFDSIALAPKITSLQHISLVRKKIMWEFEKAEQIVGFKIERKQGDEHWQAVAVELPSTAREWVDSLVLPVEALHYSYRVYSFKKSYKSVADTISFSASALPAVNDLLLLQESEKQIKLKWTYVGSVEEGFRIDRKIGEEAWETSFASVLSSTHAFIDTNIFDASKGINIEYAVYPFYKTAVGSGAMVSLNAELNPPANLIFVPGTDNTLVLQWQDQSSAETGFRIDKLNHTSEWLLDFAILGENHTEFTDSSIDLASNVYTYRVYAFNEKAKSSFTESTIGKPEITTAEAIEITQNSFWGGGNVLAENGQTVIKRGLCWSTNPNPDLSGPYAENGYGIGSFTVGITGLYPSTQYYLRAFATNIAGTSYGNQIQCTTSGGQLPSVATTAVVNITADSATCGGKILNSGSTSVTARGVCWSTNPNPNISSNHTINGSGTGSFVSHLTGLAFSTTYYVRAYATNADGTAYGNQLVFTTNSNTPPDVITNEITNYGSNFAISGGNVTSQGSSAVIARGVCWSSNQNPTLLNNHSSNGSGTGVFVSEIYGLSPGTTYYVRSYATNSLGTSYGNQVQFVTLTESVVYNPITGKIWMDRNLGASRVAQSSNDALAYGNLYQWGRDSDGHEQRTSGITYQLSNSDTPGHSNFITPFQLPYDWRDPMNNNLWQGADGINNPCPSGFRLPTDEEWEAERQSWSSNNSAGAFNSVLKLPVGGQRSSTNGMIFNEGSRGIYWSTTVSGTQARSLRINNDNALTYSNYRSDGYSVRCIRN